MFKFFSALVAIFSLQVTAKEPPQTQCVLGAVFAKVTQAEETKLAALAQTPEKEVRMQLQEELNRKGLSKEVAGLYDKKLFLEPVPSPAFALEIMKKMSLQRLSSPYAHQVIPFTIRKFMNFYQGENLDLTKIGKILQNWTDVEVAGLGKLYDDALNAIHAEKTKTGRKALPMAERLKILKNVLKENAQSERLLSALTECV